MADTSTNIARHEEAQAELNAERWAVGDLVDAYASRTLRPVEETLLDRYPAQFEGRVLELGCGAGRLTGHLIERAREVHGIDLSAEMVAYCRHTYPGATFSVGDLRDLSSFEKGGYEVVFAPFNVLDVLGDAARRTTLMQIRELLADGGLLVMSSHNLNYALRLRPRLRLHARLLVGSPRRPIASLRSLPRRLRNRRRLRPLQRRGRDHAVLNDEAHDFSVLHYYVSPDVQERQMREAGYEFLECLDLAGRRVQRGEAAAHCSELHYVARR
jgi:SAM-dependent methyltransferase